MDLSAATLRTMRKASAGTLIAVTTGLSVAAVTTAQADSTDDPSTPEDAPTTTQVDLEPTTTGVTGEETQDTIVATSAPPDTTPLTVTTTGDAPPTTLESTPTTVDPPPTTEPEVSPTLPPFDPANCPGCGLG
jgi:hypothetical protein